MSFNKFIIEKLFKSSAVGGVEIPHYLMIPAATTGLFWCSYRGYSKSMTSEYGVKPPDSATRFMTGSAMLMAGSAAFDVYDINKDIARTLHMDKEELELELVKMRKMRAGKLPIQLTLFCIATSMFLAGGLYSITRQLKTVLDNEVEMVSVSD